MENNLNDDILDLNENRNIVEEKKEDKKKVKNPVIREILSWVCTFSLAILLALFLKEFIIINATVPTSSMENTIMVGDDLFGFRLSYAFSEPERGDIIIFKYPDDRTQKFVKRIIGLPGETITIDQAKVYVKL